MNVALKQRYLTKTRFKLAIECPTKLYYTGKSNIYADSKLSDEFLKALAEGGFQVGELAKIIYPGGIEVTSTNHDDALAHTTQLLGQKNVTIFEAAIRHGNFFIRIDILRKFGNFIELIEVKAKSFDSTDPHAFRQKNGNIKKDMLPYLQDVALQRHVLELAFPHFKITSFLMMADKSQICSVDGLNQKFKISKGTDGRSHAIASPDINLSNIGNPILTSANVDEIIDEMLLENIRAPGGVSGTLAQLASLWSEKYRVDEKIHPIIGAQCGQCEFRGTPGASELKSGFHECLNQASGLSEEQVEEGTVFDIWNFRRKQELIDLGKLKLRSVNQEDLRYSEADEGLSHSQRQWMQISEEWPGGGEFYFDRELIQREMSSWSFPLHFIDFETSRVAIPFFAGQSPYANIAFQFSHHELLANGSASHKSEFLSTTPGIKPNYEFVRKLKQAIGELGTVFMWFPHENSTLNAILDELDMDPAPPADAEEIREAILSLTIKKSGGNLVRSGSRAMVDLCHLAAIAFFHPSTKGSSSIKKVLPAVMQSSTWLKERYSKPIYGSDEFPSLNFRNHIWWKSENGIVSNPYKLLPPVFNDLPQDLIEKLESNDSSEIAEGGAATTAYARLQFENLLLPERKYIEAALLRYCELDTLAMVMIYQAWHSWINV